MKSSLKLGLIIALFSTVLPMTSFAKTETSSKLKKHHIKKAQPTKPSKKGKHAVAQKSKSKQLTNKKSASDETAKLSTDINFNDSVLHGRYQTPDEATAKVENEKSLADLLAVRTEFKDRLKKASEQN